MPISFFKVVPFHHEERRKKLWKRLVHIGRPVKGLICTPLICGDAIGWPVRGLICGAAIGCPVRGLTGLTPVFW
jgi:hypothetical protein